MFWDVRTSGRRPGGLQPSLRVAGWPLVVLFANGALLSAVSGTWPLSPLTHRGVQFAIAAVYAALALAVALGERYSGVLFVAVCLATAVNGAALADAQTVTGSLVISFVFVFAGLYAAYAFTAAGLAAILVLGVAALTAGMLASPVPFRWVVWAMLALSLVTTSAVLGQIVRWLRWYATTDQLTGALTRHAMVDALEVTMRAVVGRARPVSLVLVDVDDFKAINDSRGHAAGDQVLVELVRLWRGRLGTHDIIARLGGDEFVVILVGADQERAQHLVLQLQRLSTAPWTAGVSQAQPGDTSAELLSRADHALYQAKQARRAERDSLLGG